MFLFVFHSKDFLALQFSQVSLIYSFPNNPFPGYAISLRLVAPGDAFAHLIYPEPPGFGFAA